MSGGDERWAELVSQWPPVAGTVPRVPNKRKPGQTMLTFWLPDAEAEAAREAVAALDTTISDECRRALRNTVKRAERKRAEQETDRG